MRRCPFCAAPGCAWGAQPQALKPSSPRPDLLGLWVGLSWAGRASYA